MKGKREVNNSMRRPITLIIDDGAPVNPGYWLHPEEKHVPLVPNGFALAFANLCREFGVKGKFSVLPMPNRLGRIDARLNYVAPQHLAGFLDIVRKEIAPRFDITPELLTHHSAYNLETGKFRHVYEDAWIRQATVPEITDYLALAFRILSNVGLKATGVTSPWLAGIHNEKDYAQAIGLAFYRVFRRKFTWYFLHCLGEEQPRRPWVAWRNRRRGLKVVSVPALTVDPFFETILAPTKTIARAKAMEGVDKLLERNGRRGRLRELFDRGYPLVMLTHWQSLYSEGRRAGLEGLRELLLRIEKYFGGRIKWVTVGELAGTAAE